MILFYSLRMVFLYKLKYFFRWPSFRNILRFDFIIMQGPGGIEAAETGAEFIKISFSVLARAYNIFIFLSVSTGKSAGAGHISVSFAVQNKGFKQFKHKISVFVEIDTFGFLGFF